MPCRLRPICLVFAAVLPGAQPDSPVQDSNEPENSETTARMTAMQDAVDRYRVVRGDDPERPLHLVEQPILRFSDNVTKVPDGALFLWTREKRPEALLCIWYHRSGSRYHEFQSLSDAHLLAEYRSKVRWNPEVAGIRFQTFDEFDQPADTAGQRLVQMRGLARRFRGSVTDPEFGRQELRLLPQPLYRYGEADSPILDGTIFTFAKGTNPEIMLQFEARRGDDGRYAWHYAPSRMSSRECQLRYDNRLIWRVPQTIKERPSDPYYNWVLR